MLEKALGSLVDRSVTRRLPHPSGVSIVSVGGATLGGSGKTPLAIACASALAASGARVALVGHAYRAAPLHARTVSPGDALERLCRDHLVAYKIPVAFRRVDTLPRSEVGKVLRRVLASGNPEEESAP